MRAASYVRVSTDRQADADRHSLEAQRAAFQRRCAERGYEAVAEYRDVDSGRKVAREAYQDMLTAARARQVDVIVVTFLDRFGRDQWEIMARLGELRTLGVEVDAIYEDTREFVMVALSAWKAQQESERIGERVRNSMAHAAKEGVWQGGPPPYGYGIDGKRLVVDDSEAEVVRRIFEMYVHRNRSVIEIARELNTAKVRSRTGRGWWPNTVLAIIHRATYHGGQSWGGVEVGEKAAPAIIDRETWDEAQARAALKRTLPRGQTQRSPYLLAGLLRCGECGGRMVGHTSHPKGALARGYVCANHRRTGTCSLNYHTAKHVEDAVIADLQAVAVSVEARSTRLLSSARSLRDELNLTERALAALPDRFRRNLEMFERGTYASEEQFAEANRHVEDDRVRLTAQRARLNDELARIEAADANTQAMSGIKELLTATDTATKKARLQAMIDRVTIASDGIPQVYLRV